MGDSRYVVMPVRAVYLRVLCRHDQRLTVLAREHGVGRRVADELLLVRIELEPRPYGELGLLKIDAIVGQMLLGSLEGVFGVVELSVLPLGAALP